MDYEMEELFPIVTKLARKYAGVESTSLSYEKARMLMEAVIYCLDEYWSQASGTVSRDLSAEEQYALGAELVLEKAGRIREMHNEMSASFADYGVKCLRDTVQKGIPEFLKRYDARFCPQDTILTLDYPVMVDLSSCSGADRVHGYLSAISAEQRFLGRFGTAYVISVLERYCSGYRDLYENICEILLGNVLGHMFLQKPLAETEFEREELDRLSARFQALSVSETEREVEGSIREMVGRFYCNDPQVLEYLRSGAQNLAVRIDTAVRTGRADKVFLL